VRVNFAGANAGKVLQTSDESGLLKTAQEVVHFVRSYQEAGCDELILFPTVSYINQLERLAELIG